MIGITIFSLTTFALITRRIIKDRKDYYEWYNEYTRILKK